MPRRAYTAPQLVAYGHVGQITRGDVGSTPDLPPNNNNDTCSPPIPVNFCQGVGAFS
jgi:hypothetical protein